MFERTWMEFCNKMRADVLNDDDFTDEMRIFLRSFLCGFDAAQRRNKFLVSPYDIYENDTRCSVIVHCPDDDYRFDFFLMKNKWILSFIECITLPVSDLSVVPYTAFQRLPKKEAEIRREKEVSKLIYFYNQFKELVGQQKAMEMLFDGAGEFLGAKSWVPFFDESLSYIAYAAWMENCIYGEQTEIVNFNEQCCRLLFHKHIWRRLYTMTGHIKKMIDYEEYMDIFESIWKNRAFESGWELQVNYKGEDTEMVFIKRR